MGLKQKDLMGIPWRLAFALEDDGWYLRQDIIWHKPNPMPESSRDRCTKSYEYLFLLSKSPRYYYDHNAITGPIALSSIVRMAQDFEQKHGGDRVPGQANGPMKAVRSIGEKLLNAMIQSASKPPLGNCWVPVGRARKKLAIRWAQGTNAVFGPCQGRDLKTPISRPFRPT